MGIAHVLEEGGGGGRGGGDGTRHLTKEKGTKCCPFRELGHPYPYTFTSNSLFPFHLVT